jgi:hypothetical protein
MTKRGGLMADVKIELPDAETVTITGQAIDKLVSAGDGDAALLYLYILKTRGRCGAEEAAVMLGKSADAVASAMAALSRMGLIKPRAGDDGGAWTGQNAAQRHGGAQPRQNGGDTGGEQPRYSTTDLKRELERGSTFSQLVDEAQRSLGKILSPDDLLRLLGIYDNLRLPPEVILMLVTHSIAESRARSGGRAPSMHSIEKTAYTWEREGINTLDSAERYIKKLEAKRSTLGEIKQVLQIRDRELSALEKQYVDSWIDMGFGADAVRIAYERTVIKTGWPAWPYADRILTSWHEKGMHTPDEINKKDGKYAKGTKAPAQGQDGKFGSSSPAEIERMERLLKKIKEEE